MIAPIVTFSGANLPANSTTVLARVGTQNAAYRGCGKLLTVAAITYLFNGAITQGSFQLALRGAGGGAVIWSKISLTGQSGGWTIDQYTEVGVASQIEVAIITTADFLPDGTLDLDVDIYLTEVGVGG